MPNYEWDDDKRLQTLAERYIDFEDAWMILEDRFLGAIGHRGKDGEVRWMATGLLGGVHVTIIYTMRGDVFRIISMRRAHRKEREAFDGTIQLE